MSRAGVQGKLLSQPYIDFLNWQGKMFKKLHDGYPTVRQAIVRAVLTKHRINLEDLPPAADITACTRYRPKLCRSYFLKPSEDSDYFWDGDSFGSQDENEDPMHVDSDGEDGEKHNSVFLVRPADSPSCLSLNPFRAISDRNL
jgi:hypothetical protein